MSASRIAKFILIISFLCAPAIYAARISFPGAKLKVQEVVPDKNTGLDKVYVSYDLQGLSIAYEADGSEPVTFYRYSSLGGGYAEPITDVAVQGSTYTLANPEGDMGYIIEQGTTKHYFWLVDYSAHRLSLEAVRVAEEQDCTTTHLILSGKGAPIHFYSINGRQCTLDQEIKVAYYTLSYDEESKAFRQAESVKNLESFSENVYITPPPLCNTTFTVSGDRFLEAWKWEETAESDNFHTNAVEVHTYAEQISANSDPDFVSNQINTGDSGGLGGSAPADINFTAIVSDAVIHHEWQFASDQDFENLLYRFNEQDVSYTFREEGTTYVRYIGSNDDGTCEAVGDTFIVNIGASELKCPNAFSPGASEGVNDEWKVSYRSIVDFECWIFNRHGRQLFHFTDPTQGWDGKVGGKVVKSGVYYYVIEATGADGKKYKLSGDINVIGYKGRTGTSSGSESEGE